jgi:CDP-paratose 2-epimerase
MSSEPRDEHQHHRPQVPAERDGRVVITGGAGFVGSNLADRVLAAGRDVAILDDLSRPGVEKNLEWLLRRHGGRARFHRADVRDRDAVESVTRDAAAVFHFAAQVAVTTSIDDPRRDFEVNAGGTLNVLETLRRQDEPAPLLFTSTNKVYGDLEHVDLRTTGNRYEPQSAELRQQGVDERMPLDFHTPYGCSKGTADQYALDYSRNYGIPAVVFRMSCIYGPRQFGTEDQGWVAHLMLRAMRGQRLTLYGDGMQVRDVLFVEDLVDAQLLAWANSMSLGGCAFNIGGGPKNTVSLLELVEKLGALQGRPPEVAFAPWRAGDQRYYVSDTGAFRRVTGWEPRVRVDEGIDRLHEWLVTGVRDTAPTPSISSGMPAAIHASGSA